MPSDLLHGQRVSISLEGVSVWCPGEMDVFTDVCITYGSIVTLKVVLSDQICLHLF